MAATNAVRTPTRRPITNARARGIDITFNSLTKRVTITPGPLNEIEQCLGEFRAQMLTYTHTPGTALAGTRRPMSAEAKKKLSIAAKARALTAKGTPATTETLPAPTAATTRTQRRTKKAGGATAKTMEATG